MPRHLKLKKDATNGETRRGVVRTRRSVDIRMGKPGMCNSMSSMCEYIAHERGTRRTETSKYPEEKKTKCDSLSSGERKGKSPNQSSDWGCRTTTKARALLGERH